MDTFTTILKLQKRSIRQNGREKMQEKHDDNTHTSLLEHTSNCTEITDVFAAGLTSAGEKREYC